MPPTTGTPVELEGGERTLRYDKNAIYQLQQRCGSLGQIVSGLVTGNSNSVVDLVWAGLLHESKSPSIREVVELVPLPPPPELLLGVMKAIAPTFGAEKNPDFVAAVAMVEATLEPDNDPETEAEEKKRPAKRATKGSGNN